MNHNKQKLVVPEIKIHSGTIDVNYVTLFWEHGNIVSGYIPGFDIAFSAPTKERAEAKSIAMIKTFFDYWVKQNGFKKFVLKIHELGFKSKLDAYTIKELLNRNTDRAKFSLPKEAMGLESLQEGYIAEHRNQTIEV